MGVRWELSLFISDHETVLLAHPTPQRPLFSFDGKRSPLVSAGFPGRGLSSPTPIPAPFSLTSALLPLPLSTSARFQASFFKTKQTKLSQPPASSALLSLNGAPSTQAWHRSLRLLRTQPPKPDCAALPGRRGRTWPCPRPHCPVIFIPFSSIPCLGSCPDLPFRGQ